MSTIKVILGDCMEVMAQYEPKHFDLAVVDPPYGIGMDKETTSMSAGTRKDGTVRKMKSWSNPKEKGYIKKEWDKNKPSKEYWNELMRITNNQIVWGGNYFSNYLKPNGGWIVWEKGVPEGMSLSQAELAWNSCLNSVRIVKVLWAGYKKANNEDRFHPTQKPVALYDWIYQKYLPEGGKVLDTHGGSMSNVISWIKAGNIDGVCVEIDPDYFHDAKKRIQNFLAQQDMFRNPVTVEFIENKMSMK